MIISTGRRKIRSACSADKIEEFAPLGVRGFVIGTTLLFGKGRDYGETIERIRRMEF